MQYPHPDLRLEASRFRERELRAVVARESSDPSRRASASARLAAASLRSASGALARIASRLDHRCPPEGSLVRGHEIAR